MISRFASLTSCESEGWLFVNPPTRRVSRLVGWLLSRLAGRPFGPSYKAVCPLVYLAFCLPAYPSFCLLLKKVDSQVENQKRRYLYAVSGSPELTLYPLQGQFAQLHLTMLYRALQALQHICKCAKLAAVDESRKFALTVDDSGFRDMGHLSQAPQATIDGGTELTRLLIAGVSYEKLGKEQFAALLWEVYQQAQGWDPVQLAIYNDLVDVVEILLDQGADVNLVGSWPSVVADTAAGLMIEDLDYPWRPGEC